MDSSSAETPDPRATRRILGELLALEREIVELGYVRRADSLERARDAVRRLGEVGSPQGILGRAADELGASSQFERVLISEVDARVLRPSAIWSREAADAAATALQQLRSSSIVLEYPLIEDEVAARQRVEIVEVARHPARAPRRAAICSARLELLRGRAARSCTARPSGYCMRRCDRERPRARRPRRRGCRGASPRACPGVFERAVLRETAEPAPRLSSRSAVQWMSGAPRAADRRGIRLGPIRAGARRWSRDRRCR